MAKYDDKNWIPDFDPADPPGTEEIALGDNLLRAFTRALQNHFPNVAASDVYTGTLAQLNSIATGEAFPRDSIIMWAGDQTVSPDGPAGWTICDGRARKDGGGGTAPDLTSKFIIGAQPDTGVNIFAPYVGGTGGKSEIDIRKTNGQLVEFTTQSHVLTEDEIAGHTHAMFANDQTNGDGGTPGVDDLVTVFGDNVGSNRAYKMQPSNAGSATVGRTGSAGTGAAVGHSHKFSIDGSSTFTGANLPPYFAAIYLIKD